MSAPYQVSEATEVKEAALGPSQPSSRLVSLDVFRGLAIVLMLLVNNCGEWPYYYSPLIHAEWHGFHLADLVFPSFVGIMGVSVVYGLAAVRPDGARHRPALGRVARRVAVLVVLGLLIGLIPNFYFTSFRIPGVLQRLGLVYGVCAVLYLKTTWRQQVWLAVGLLVLYAALLQLVPVPGIGPANLEPATNLGAWLDRLLFSRHHLNHDQEGWDPESVLGLIPSVGTGILGLLAGQWLRRPTLDGSTKAAWLFVVSAGLVVLGLIWNGWFPINKPLWTSSYVLYAGGLAGLVLAALYFLCDVQGWRGAWTWPLVACGSNALLVFFVPEALDRFLTRFRFHHPDGSVFYARDWLYAHWRPLFTDAYHASLGWAVVYTLLWVLILSVLYRRRLFFTA
ncbi:acyltransferase family protein [Hymenobacter sp. DG01]|uniref:acyltransferase family protein n=1 Tax=Hymenobacter sp. DG01 TaxID=2584940 RepID=UPI001121973D|nr:heparan-alpha-glucosaminide N-acetyltransferase domain-containing protein [Hymenobacter sp. DG01]